MSRWKALTRDNAVNIIAGLMIAALVIWGSYSDVANQCRQAGDSYCASLAVGYVVGRAIFWVFIGIIIGGVVWLVRRKRKPTINVTEA